MDLSRFVAAQRVHLVDIAGTDPRTGRDYRHKAFLPPPLPDSVELSPRTWKLVADTSHVLGRLSQASAQIPNVALFRAPSLRREAQSTAALEGTYEPFEAVLEADVNPQAVETSPRLRDIVNYIAVAERGLQWAATSDVTVGLLCELQQLLVRGTPGESSDSGRIRTRQVVIGAEGSAVEQARFVPPPPGPALEAAMHDLQQWLASPPDLPPVVVAAMAHHQFEALHPFVDGNGRVGRLLIVMHLIRSGALQDGLLSVSPWFEDRRAEYQDHLLNVSLAGEWEPWIAFCCEAVRDRANATVEQVRELLEYHAHLRDRARTERWRGTVQHVLDDLIGHPVLTARSLAERHQVTTQAAYVIIERLLRAGVLTELTGRTYDRVFSARRVVEIASR